MCNGVRTEKLSFLADVNRYTERYAEWVGRQCREKSVKAVAEETGLGWDTVKDLDKIGSSGFCVGKNPIILST